MVVGNPPESRPVKSSRSNHRTFNQGNPQKALRFSLGRNSGQELLRFYPHLEKLAALIRSASCFMPTFKRVHESGTESIINQDEHGCHVRLDVREPNHPPSTIVGFFAPTLDAAKQLADEEMVKLGHACYSKCNRWAQF